jgi:hypothetical protein
MSLYADITRAHSIETDRITLNWYPKTVYPSFMGEIGLYEIPSYDSDLYTYRKPPRHLLVADVDLNNVSLELDGLYPSQGDFEKITGWMHECDCKHAAACAPKSRDKLQNLRVIDCQHMLITSLPSDQEFTALSYVWGSSPNPADSYFVPSEGLLMTIEDSITATLALGYRYLWVDKYVRYIGSALQTLRHRPT